jgi:phage FluMu protein gp41
MDRSRTPAPDIPGIDDLFKLTLVDGLKVVTSEGKELRYKGVLLRETNVGHERIATRQAERVIEIRGVSKLIVSDADFRLALTAQHIEAFLCDGQSIIHAALIDLATVDKLSHHDIGLIEQRVFLITLAAELRYGNITQETFDAVITGKAPEGASKAPQPVGQAPGMGADAASPESGPALLADFAGSAAGVPPAVDAR